MKKEQLLFVPLVGKTSACRQKEGLKLIENLPLLPRLTAVLPPQGREIARGFTLIELLVVVLIIGILAAVALPQYQKAVDKTRIMSAFQLARSIKMAQEMYYLENGNYTTRFEDLSLGFNATGAVFFTNNFTFDLKQQRPGTPWSVYASAPQIGVLLIVGYDRGTWKGKSACYTPPSNERGKKACSSLTKSEPATNQTDYWVYTIEL